MTIPKEIQENRIAWAKSDAQRDKGLTMPEDVEQFCQIAYAEDGLAAHTLNVYRPKNAGDTLPLLISIHGGGWFYAAGICCGRLRLSPCAGVFLSGGDRGCVPGGALVAGKPGKVHPEQALVYGGRLCRGAAGEPVLHSGRQSGIPGTAGLLHL